MTAKIREKIDELYALFTMSKTVTSVDSAKMLNFILEKTRHLMKAQFCSLRLLGESRRKLMLASHAGEDESAQKDLARFENGLAKKVMAKAELLVINDTADAFKAKVAACYKGHGIHSLLVAPLFSYNRKIGALFVYISEKREFSVEDTELLEITANFCSSAIDHAAMFERVKSDYLNTIKMLAKIIDANDAYTRGHCDKVTGYALRIAREMNMPSRALNTIKIAGLLHDIGKVGIDLSIIRKPGPLTDEDWTRVRAHPEIGARIVRQIGFLNEIVPVIKHHHERFAGGGYPKSEMKGEKIPLDARIIAVADAYDAMTSFRPYRDPMPKREAIAELQRCAGTQFDPTVVSAFLRTL